MGDNIRMLRRRSTSPQLLHISRRGLYLRKFTKNFDPDVGHAHSENGWTDRYISCKWVVEHLLVHDPPSAPGLKRFLLKDNHNSQNTKNFQAACYVNDIILLWSPNHHTHLLQLLDVTVFSKFDRMMDESEPGGFLPYTPAF